MPGWSFCFSAENRKEVFYPKNFNFNEYRKRGGGVVYVAASFFVLRDYRKELDALDERVEDLEYDRLLKAYRREGYEVD